MLVLPPWGCQSLGQMTSCILWHPVVSAAFVCMWGGGGCCKKYVSAYSATRRTEARVLELELLRRNFLGGLGPIIFSQPKLPCRFVMRIKWKRERTGLIALSPFEEGWDQNLRIIMMINLMVVMW